MSNQITLSEWYFEKDSCDVNGIEEALAEPVCKWCESTETILRRHLAANPTQKSAAQACGSRFIMDGLCGACLFLLVISRDNPLPEQCVVFVGTEGWIMRKKADLMAQFQEQLAKPGACGVMVEEN